MPASLDPRLADPELLALAVVNLKARQAKAEALPRLVVVWLEDGESREDALARALPGQRLGTMTTVLYVQYAEDRVERME